MIDGMQPELSPAELAVLAGIADCEVTPIKHYAEIEGSLNGGDCQTRDGRPADYYGLKNDRGSQTEYGRVYTTFRVSSREIDSFIRLRTKDRLQFTQDDDSGGGVDAFLRVPLAENIYLIEVTSTSPGPAEGTYTLALSRVSPSPR